MPFFVYAKAVNPEMCFPISEIPPTATFDAVTADVKPMGVCTVLVEARTLKSARQKGNQLIEDALRESEKEKKKQYGNR